MSTALIAEARPRLDEAVDFLTTIATGSGRIAVARIEPDGPINGAAFTLPAERAALTAWLETYNGRENLYYTLNEPKPAAECLGRGGRLRESDVKALRGVAVDLDPRPSEEATEGGFARERRRLLGVADEWRRRFLGAPSAIVDSGNGVQMVWLFAERLSNTPENRAAVKAQARGLGRLFGAGSDAVQSVDHLFRIPGTLNLPTAKKRSKGRGSSLSRVLHVDARELYGLAGLRAVALPVTTAPGEDEAHGADIDYPGVIAAALDPSVLSSRLSEGLETLRSKSSAILANGDRSERDFALAARCAELGFSDPTDVAKIVFALSPEKLLEKDEQGFGKSYATSTVVRALGKVSRHSAEALLSPIDDTTAATPPKGLYVVSGIENAAALPVREWVVCPRLPLGDVTQCVGEPGISKSTFALRDALAIVTGNEALLRGRSRTGDPISPERLHVSGAAIVYNAEDRLDEMRRRLAAAQRHYGVRDEDMKHPLVLWSGVDNTTLTIMRREGERGALKRAPGADGLEAVIREHRAVLAVLDPQISLTSGGNENSNDDQDALLQTLAQIAAHNRCCVMVIHHTAKATRDNKGDMGAGRGGFAAVGKVRCAFTLCNVTGEGDEKALGVSRGDGFIRLDYAKVSHDRRPPEPIILHRASAPVGNGTGARPEAAAMMFNESPREALRISGDFAPVLDIVDHRALKAKAEASASQDPAKAQPVAAIADALLGDADKKPLADLLDAIGERMRVENICAAKTAMRVRGVVLVALRPGVEMENGGRRYRLRVTKLRSEEKAPWWLLREEIGSREGAGAG